MLIAQSLACRYREAFQKDQPQHPKFSNHPHQMPTTQGWQVIIKVAHFRNRKTKRSGWAYVVITMDGAIILKGGESSGRKLSYQSSQEVVKEAIFKSKELGFSKMLILCNTKRLVRICNQRRNPTWLEQTIISDLVHLQQQGLIITSLFVPKEVIADFLYLAHITTCFPVHYCRLRPDLFL